MNGVSRVGQASDGPGYPEQLHFNHDAGKGEDGPHNTKSVVPIQYHTLKRLTKRKGKKMPAISPFKLCAFCFYSVKISSRLATSPSYI